MRSITFSFSEICACLGRQNKVIV